MKRTLPAILAALALLIGTLFIGAGPAAAASKTWWKKDCIFNKSQFIGTCIHVKYQVSGKSGVKHVGFKADNDGDCDHAEGGQAMRDVKIRAFNSKGVQVYEKATMEHVKCGKFYTLGGQVASAGGMTTKMRGTATLNNWPDFKDKKWGTRGCPKKRDCKQPYDRSNG